MNVALATIEPLVSDDDAAMIDELHQLWSGTRENIKIMSRKNRPAPHIDQAQLRADALRRIGHRFQQLAEQDYRNSGHPVSDWETTQ